MTTSGHLRVAVVQFPGSNCEEETAWSLASVGLGPWIHRWNEPASVLKTAAAVILPGGFSFQDRVRAGALAGKLPLMEAVVEMAAEGKPVLGICNGAQILVEAGLLPGLIPERVEMCLAGNRMTGRSGYYSRWVHLEVKEPATECVFTQTLKPGDLLPLPVAHAEGRFHTIEDNVSSVLSDLIPLSYADPEKPGSVSFPWNPNGSLLSAAGIMNRKGNVFGMMPHPERALWNYQVPPFLGGIWGERRRRFSRVRSEGPGWHIFRSLALSLRRRSKGGVS